LKTFVKIAAHLRWYFCLLKNMIIQNLSQSSPKCATLKLKKQIYSCINYIIFNQYINMLMQ